MSRTSRANAVAAEANGPISLCAVTTCPYPSGVLLPGDIDNWHRCGAAVGALPHVNHFKHRHASGHREGHPSHVFRNCCSAAIHHLGGEWPGEGASVEP